MTRYAIEAEGLVKRYGRTTALAGVDLVAREGAVLALLGPNGAGKTTTVRMLATLIGPDAGHASVGGYDVVRDAARVRRLIGLTGQYASVDEEMTGFENLVLLGRLLDFSRADARARAGELLERFQLSDAAHRPPGTYSGGMRRRLDLAASLVGRPRFLYLDEPTTGLDPRSRGDVWDLIRGLVADEGVTVLLTTQYLDEADQLAHDIAVIDRGLVIANGTADSLKTQIGGQSLEIRPSDPARVDDTAAILTELTGQTPDRDSRPGVVTVPVHDPDLLPYVVRRLEEAGIRATELALRLPSLDEVFLELTGRPQDAEPGPESAAA
ncbi:ATP-binding cassette domain-containing protein [Yinghuangia sp. ASG 101]|uniref:ATP-binding cassette domain-containing protein n=1 Tax=Yinghuangia sp. ASG 101 TaxID=2896848 RepID=UPI001E40926E|nr:ATP-binding cassette domain-containing protein [Yinghuangia sp. ASG 101]UGQ13734.1 ATP-binding cassette domain-containing protein [Yinghuangia sp. ASG 101]